MRHRLAFCLSALLTLTLTLPGGTVLAATPGLAAVASSPADPATTATEGLSEDEIRELVARLDDAAVRQLLIERLDAENHRAAAAQGVTERMQHLELASATFRLRFQELLRAVPELPAVLPFALSTLRGDRPAIFFLFLALGFTGMVLAGWLAERGFRHVARDGWSRIASLRPTRALGKCGALLARLGLELVALAVFVAGAVAVFFILHQGDELTRITVMTYLAAITAVRLYALGSRFLLAPAAPALRLMAMDDGDARYLHRQNIVIASVTAFGFLSCALLQAYGLEGRVHHLLLVLVGAWMTGTIAYTMWHGRHGLTTDLRGGEPPSSRVRALFAELWPKLLPLVVVLLFLVVLLVVLAGGDLSYMTVFGSFFVLLFVPHIDAGIERAARQQLFSDELRGQLGVVALRAGRILLLVFAALFLLRIWGVDLFSLAERGVGIRLAGALTDIGLTVLVAYVLWEIARINIDRRLAAEVGALGEGGPERGDEGGVGGSRLATLLPLLRLAIQITIAVMVVMLVLSALGVNIGPLLAGAGVVGIAVGFGAQTLVRDIVSGVFFLVDDAFRVGEYIDVGLVKGTVEKISIRSLRLRHHRGPLHTIPFGEIRHLTNFSRDWAIMKLEFRVTYNTDVRLVKKLFKQIGQDLLQDPELGPDFIEPFKSQGVLAMEDSAMIIRGKFMAVPGKQFTIRKEVYNRVQQAFNEHGIEFAHRRVSVELPPGIDPASPEGKKIADSAAASVAAEDEQQGGPGKAPSAA